MKKPGKPKNPNQLVRTHLMIERAVLAAAREWARTNDRSLSAEINRLLKDKLVGQVVTYT